MRSFIVLLVAFSFFTISSFILTSPIGNSGWQRVGKNGAYQWRVDNEYIFVYIVECFGRLILSLIFWTTVGLGFFVLLGGTNNRFQVCSIVCLSSAIISICSVHMGLQEFDLAFLQIPSVSNKIPLSRLLFRQVVYVAISIVWIAITLIIQKIRQTRRNWINEAQNRALYYVLLVIVSPLLSTFVRNMNYNDSNLFLYVFGGIEWGHPNVFITDCIGWVVLYLPVLCILENKRSKINRKLTYREGMGISVLCSLGMFLTVIILNVLNDGHFEKVILSNDICIETIIVLLLAFFWFVLHMNIISSIYVTLSNWFDSELIGIATQLSVFAILLLHSNEDRLLNEKIFVNWGMILRSSLFSQSQIREFYADGTSKLFNICSVDVSKALIFQLILLGLIVIIGSTLHKRKTM